MSGATVRTTVVLPVETLETLKRLVSERKRSEFIAEAVEKQLDILRFREGLKAGFGAWTDENHPDLNTAEDMRRYLRGLRDPASWRTTTLPEE
ncbi:hypothetical protein FJZ36_09490 [Candidatus Poribacteria bacterium]|nr:hypothetical protein [Candidatus Poribacteria bacterium]